jgi:excisionase family DNA binding protein
MAKTKGTTNKISGYYTARGAAEKIGVTEATVQVQLWRGVITGVKVGGAWLIHEDEVKRYRAENKGNVGRPPKAANA